MSMSSTWTERQEPAAIVAILKAHSTGAALRCLKARLIAMPGSLYEAFMHRRTMMRFSRYSDHLLDDLGYERDWDRTIIPRQ